MKRSIANPMARNNNPFAPQVSGGSYERQEITHEAVVVDVVVNDEHPAYASDGYNVGAIQFRALKSDAYREQDQLNWALPLESNITDYPLLNELVFIHSSLNRFYYSRKINVTSGVSNHAIFGLNEELSPIKKPSEKASDRKKSTVNPRVDDSGTTQTLGKKFVVKKVYRLRSDEGDIIYEGRSGQSIRFGTSWKTGTMFQSTKNDQSPNLLFRVGPDTSQEPKPQFGLVKEDINKDLSSLWMVSDQIIPLEYATSQISIHGASFPDIPRRLDGNQIVINTDRFVVNTKSDKIMGFSAKGIHWTSGDNFSIDALKDYQSKIGQDRKLVIDRDTIDDVGRDQIVTITRNQSFTVGKVSEISAGSKISLISPKVFIGLKQGESEPIICGATMAQFLGKFLDAFIQQAATMVMITSSPGSPSAMNPALVAKLTQLKQDVAKGAKASFNSSVAFTTK